MPWKPRTWFLLSLMLFLAAAFFWQLGNAQRSKPAPPPPTAKPTNLSLQSLALPTLSPSPIPLLTRLGPNPVSAGIDQPPNKTATTFAKPFPYRLRNTAKSLDELIRSQTAILLQNAFLDTSKGMALPIPDSLRAKGEPGSYIIQSREPLNDAFRTQLRAHGAAVVAYIPNNAYLVRLSAAGAAALAANPKIQAVLPYEPYYKLNPELLPIARADQALPADTWLNVTLFPGDDVSGRAALEALGAEVVAESRSPFGPLLTIRPPNISLAALAQLPGVQGIEKYRARRLANDLTRQRLGVAADTVTNGNYLDLTGTNILVNINDSGVDAKHPDLQSRVLAADPFYLTDPFGHGTHVAGIIASSGGKSDTVTNAPGSLTNAHFRGMAPAAKLFVLPVDILRGPIISDIYLQETAARTNAIISNNSWSYPGARDYDTAAASYDAAVRDALPDRPGSQPLAYVFAAGNIGFGNEDGSGGEPDSIESPATAKNVITVGALDQFRNLTNEVAYPDDAGNMVTNRAFQAETDSDNQVSPFSSRGNVGIGTEGNSGRFKPDVVAPGAFVISTKATGWIMDTNPPRTEVNRFQDQEIVPGALNNYFIFVPDNAIRLELRVISSAISTNPPPALPIYARLDDFPNSTVYDVMGANEIIFPRDYPLTPGSWYYSVGNNSPRWISYDVETVLVLTNAYGTYYQVLQQLNDGLGPYYRFSSGTSMAAPAVSGLLALMKEFFEQKLPANLRRTNSPALMKALLINGARSVNPTYDLATRRSLNTQGWGLTGLPNSVPSALTNSTESSWPIQFVDQSPTNAVATGESRSWSLKLSPDAQAYPLRITLVWTDPPGNPNAAVKLVNDLDLIVTQSTNQIFYGNDIPPGSDYNQSWNTNSSSASDVINNVENVFIREPQDTNYTITVVGQRVNVNAVASHTNQVAQDFALVVSSANLALTNAFTFTFSTNSLAPRPVTAITNGIALLNERVGANSPLLGLRHGVTNQWNFYVFTNTYLTNLSLTLTNGTNVAFITFLPPNLALPRNVEADIDLYVSGNPALTNLDATALALASKSTNRGGTEVVFFTNAALGQVFYIGVKAEDQQAAEYAFIGISSDIPFDQSSDGNRILQGFPINTEIPDGSPAYPGGTNILAIATQSFTIGRVIVTNLIAHEDLGDLVGILSHGGQFVVLNNHSLNNGMFSGTNLFIHDDSNQGDIFYSRPTDGPGSLLDFVGASATGVWILSMVDNSLGHTGRVMSMQIRLDPQQAATGLSSTVLANSFDYFMIDIPPEATNLIVKIWDLKPNAPLNIYVRRGDLPDTDVYDKAVLMDPNQLALTNYLALSIYDSPPLTSGRYYIGVFNPNAFPVSYRIDAELEYSLVGAAIQTFVSTNTPIRLKDDAVIVATNYVPIDRQVVDVQVGVRLEHPRVSDLVLHLVSPQGTRALLVENRGGLTTNGFGSGLLNSYNLVYLTFTENTNLASSLIKFGQPPFTANTTTNTVFSSSFENIAATNYDQNAVVDGWTVVTNSVDVAATPGAHSGKNVLRLNLGRIARTLRTTPGRQYQLTFAYRSEAAGALNGQVILDGAVQALIAATNRWQIHALNFTATANSHLVEITPAVRRTGLVVDSFILAESGGTLYYLPEESLSLFQAERALGNWRLEIWDSRAGATNNPAPTLVSWQLQMVFTVPGQSATVLANGVPVTDTVSGIEIKYFVVNVPPTAIVATNVLIGTGDLVLIGRRSGLPVGDQSVDDYYVDDRGAGAGEYLFISTNWPITAPLQPGQRYYLGVKNANPNETNTFTIWVGFWPPPQPILPTVTALANGLPITRTLTNGPVLDYYQFTVSSNAIATWFELFPSNGDVNLLLRKASQVVNPLPTTSRYDYRSINAGSSPDQILVLTNSLPVPLAPGIWYLGVFNVESFPVTYTIRATELTNVPITVIDLTNGIPRRFSVGTSGTLQDFFRFRITDSNVAARFDLFNLTGNADLVLRRALYPSATNYDAGSFTAGTADEQLIIRTNAGPANLILTDLNGDWYLAVLNRENFPVDGAIRALLTPSFTPLTNAIAITNRIGPGPSWTYYEFTVSSNATMAMFEALPRNGDLALFVRKYQPVPEPWPTLSNFDYFSDQPAANAEQIIVFTNSAPVPLWPGTWYLAVYNDSPAPITYSIVATEYFNAVPPIGILTNGIVVTQTLAVTNALDYFQFTVSSNAIQAVFETFAADGNVNLYVRRGLPLPTPTNFHYLSATPGTNDERVIVHPLSTPVPVSPGTWFLGVSNADTNPVTYSLRATELLMPANYVIRSQLTITNGMIRLTWNSLIGFRYYIEGKTNVADPQWDVISPTITATSTQTVYWIALPTPYHFFQVKQGTPPPPPVQPTIITLANSVPLNASVEAGTQLTNFFLFSITNANYAACFELFNLTGSADLVLRRDQLPSTNNYDFLSAAPSTNAESIGLRTNPGPASLILTNLNGDWYLAVLNQETVPVNFTLLATAMLPPVPLTNAVAVTNSIGPGPAWHYYEFAVSSNATQAAFTAAPTDGNLALFLRQTSPTAQSWLTLNSYDYLSDLSGTNVEQIVVTPDTLPISLAPGIWSLGVFNRDTNSFAYSVVAAELAPPPPILINPYLVRTNNLLGLTWNSLVGTNYYVEGRTNVADRTWDIISPTITATNTLTTYYIALPTPYHFFQIKQGTVPLPPTIVISPQPIITSNSVCLTWTSQVGTNYYVAGRTNVADPQWYPVSPTITATNTVTSYCIPRPTPFHFFQIVQGPETVPEFGPAILPANLTLTTNGFTLQWTAPSYLQFQVEYSSNLRDWTRFPNPVSSTTGLFTFTDSTVPRGSSVLLRFYRLVLFP